MYFDRVLWGFTRGFRARVLLGVALGLASFAAATARLVLLGLLLARVIQGAALAELAPLLFALAIGIAVRGAVQYAKDMVAYEAAGFIQRVLRNRLYEKLIELGPAHLGKARSGA